MKKELNNIFLKIANLNNNTPLIINSGNISNYEYIDQILIELLNHSCDLNMYKNSINFLSFNSSEIKKSDLNIIYNHINNPTLENNLFKTLVFENIEDLSLIISNSLLKTLEEPPKNCFIIFTTNNISRVLDTIKSRCLIFNLNNFNVSAKKNKIQHCKLNNVNDVDKNYLNSVFSNQKNFYYWLDSELSNDVIECFVFLNANINNEVKLFEWNSKFIKLEYKQIKILINWILNKFSNHNCCNHNLEKIVNNFELNLSKNYIYFCFINFLKGLNNE